jgi:nicotinate-nucleotide pyrophosphorylase (carboxylating)
MKPDEHLIKLIDLALAEDLGSGDLTTETIFPRRYVGRAVVAAREKLVVSGLPVAREVFRRLSQACRFQPAVSEGTQVPKGAKLASVRGPVRALLSGERTALNFLRHLSGIATLTRSYVKELQGRGCVLLDTRKTTPGMRALEKAAVKAGGGSNHRMGLFDGVIIKDNHISAAGSIKGAVARVKKRAGPKMKIEVECTGIRQVQAALEAGADIIMLDNMSPRRMSRAVEVIAGRAQIEASGRVTLKNIAKVARSGVDYVSVGTITHSARSVDIAMDMNFP